MKGIEVKQKIDINNSLIEKAMSPNIWTLNNTIKELLIENEENTVVINIARKPIFGINKQYLELAPSKELFEWFQKHKKKEEWFKEYKRKYKKQIQNDKRALASMRQIKNEYLDKGIDVMLVCFCRDVYKCHRRYGRHNTCR